MTNDIMCFIPLERISLFYKYYTYLDAKNYQADGLFIKHRVPVKFLREYGKEDSQYVFVLCRVHKRDEKAFLEALKELPNKMLLCGYPDYADSCRWFQSQARQEQKRKTGESA